MMRLLRAFFIVLCLGGAAAMIAACSDDPAGPATGRVAGTITFQGAWPTTGDVQVSIYSNLAPPYVPMGPPDAFTDPIQPGSMTFDYNMAGLDPGDYTALYVSWRDPVNPAGARLLGMYWAFADSVGISSTNGLPVVAPASILITDGSLYHLELDIQADLDLAP